jgi:hypothetical protein
MEVERGAVASAASEVSAAVAGVAAAAHLDRARVAAGGLADNDVLCLAAQRFVDAVGWLATDARDAGRALVWLLETAEVTYAGTESTITAAATGRAR